MSGVYNKASAPIIGRHRTRDIIKTTTKRYDGHGRASKKWVGKRNRGPCLTPVHSLLGVSSDWAKGWSGLAAATCCYGNKKHPVRLRRKIYMERK